jgi:hypothetical protein
MMPSGEYLRLRAFGWVILGGSLEQLVDSLLIVEVVWKNLVIKD